MATTTTDPIAAIPFVPLAEGNVHLRRHPHAAQQQLAVVGRQLAPLLLRCRRRLWPCHEREPSFSDSEPRRTLRRLYHTLWEERREVPPFVQREWLDTALTIAETLGESGAALAWLLDGNTNASDLNRHPISNNGEKGDVETAEDVPKKQRKEEEEAEEGEEVKQEECDPTSSQKEGKKRKPKETQTKKKWSLWFASKHKSNTVHYMTLRTFLLPDGTSNTKNRNNNAIYCISASDVETMDTAAFHRRVHMYLRCGELCRQGRAPEAEYDMYEGLRSLVFASASPETEDDETQRLVSFLVKASDTASLAASLRLVGAVRYRVVSEVALLRLGRAAPRCTLTWRLLASCCLYLARQTTEKAETDGVILYTIAHYIEHELVPYVELRDRGLNAATIVSFPLLAAVWAEPSQRCGLLDMPLPSSLSTAAASTLRGVLGQQQQQQHFIEEQDEGKGESYRYSQRIYQAVRCGCGWAAAEEGEEEEKNETVQALLVMMLVGSCEHEPKDTKDLLLQYGSEPHQSAWLHFINQFLLRTPMEALERRNPSA